MNPINLPDAWPLPSPWTMHFIDGGANNRSYLVKTPSEKYILRIYQNAADSGRIAYEHALLTQLDHSGLSFAVPTPIPTRSGVTVIEVPAETGIALAALFPYIPGRHPDAGNQMQAYACAAALAELDRALSDIDLQPSVGALPAFGDLYHVHQSVPDPFVMVQELPLPEDERARVMDIFQELLALTPALYCSLPQQIVHRDFDGGNTLMEGSRVTGVLDFEFACPDLRAMDFAYALYSFTSWAWDTESGEELIRAFVTGFRESIILTPAEIEAVPDLMRLYRVVTLIHRAGRHRQGLAREEAVLIRVKSLLQLDRSLRERREVLLSVIYDAAA